MMFWYGHPGGGWGWIAMSIGMILFWALVITALVLLFRTLSRPHEHAHAPAPPTPPAPTPEQILAERFARSEIDEEEYQRRLSVLRSLGPRTPPAA
ncbi:SHOCT domain-containing protein [Streptomyces sp. NPDC052396]|uniref:SHOCT domain-containing protein n=1 Tax=Streptomyces sp. NPDC052396 TaxID=3365689 RepID=UPI0037CF2C5D